MPTPANPLLPPEDLALLADMRKVCQTGGNEVPTERRDAFDELTERLSKRLEELWIQARSVADANARAIELVEQQVGFNEQLREQNRELARQKKQIDQALRDLHDQTAAMAEANVDAVMHAEASGSKLQEVTADQETLRQVNNELLERMRQLEQEALAMAEANVDAITMMEEKESSISELESRARELESVRKELEGKAFCDGLTGLFNYRYFERELGLEFERAKRHSRSLTLIFMDVDHFKRFNDTYGHKAGDHVLRTISDVLRSRIRNIDTPACLLGVPFAARYGGEEFVIMLPETTVREGVIVAERIRAIIEGLEVAMHGESLGRITLSAGVAELTEQDTEPDMLIKRADGALYAAKDGGRNQVKAASFD